MRPFAFVAALLTLCAGSVRAQTITTTDELGQTVVEFITVDPLQAIPVTQTLQTLTTTTPAVPAGQQGPVGAPPATTANAEPTIYTYTTTDAGGDTIQVVDTFTPTFTTTSTWLSAPPGTILDYSSWRSMVGTNTVAPAISGASARWSLEPRWAAIATSLCAGMMGGAWLAFA
ncbi:hypothetical protein BV20DRAFT_974575 [Pilatotrama ljubarskyi]|nr:hypothetical protein BV20DRAFT_974575 [Pilatotrama ljubarskyi]